MTHEDRAELRALATLLEERWPTKDCTAVAYSGPVVAVVDARVKDYAIHVSAVTL